MPNVRKIAKTTLKRHDIIHRSGVDKDGLKINISDEELTQLFQEVTNFAKKVNEVIQFRPF